MAKGIRTIYDPETGRILGAVKDYLDDDRAITRNSIAGEFDGATHYVENGQAVERSPSPVSFDGTILENLPAGSTLTINGDFVGEFEGTVEIDDPAPLAELRITVLSPRHMRFTHVRPAS